MTADERRSAESVADFAPVIGMFLGDLNAIADTLELIRQRTCLYGPQARTCDCKMRGETQPLGQSEASGCYELRAAIAVLRHAETTNLIDMQRRLDRQERAFNNILRAVAYGTQTDGSACATPTPKTDQRDGTGP